MSKIAKAGKTYHEIFRPGDYPQGDFPVSFCESVAENYDPTFCEAPVTIDHAQSGFAEGWIDDVIFEDGLLKASFHQISDDLVAQQRSGKIKTVSSEFFFDLEGKGPYLRALSFLGAATPAVRGLKPITFKASESRLARFDLVITPAAAGVSDAVPVAAFAEITDPAILRNEIAKLTADNTRLSASFAASEQEKAAAKTRLEGTYLEQRKIGFEQFLNEQIAFGNLNDEMKTKALQLLDGLALVAKFSEGQEDPLDKIKGLIKAIPRFVPDTEVATRGRAQDAAPDTVSFGSNVEPSRMQLHAKVVAFSKAHNITYEQALERVMKG